MCGSARDGALVGEAGSIPTACRRFAAAGQVVRCAPLPRRAADAAPRGRRDGRPRAAGQGGAGAGVGVIGMADNILRPILVGRDTGIPDWVVLLTTLGGIATLGLSGIVVGPLLAGLFLTGWAIMSEQRGVVKHPDPVPEGETE